MKKNCIILILTCLTLAGYAQEPNFEWAKIMGGESYDRAYSVTTDAEGNVYTTGTFQGTVDFDPSSGVNNITSMGGFDMFIQKLDANGNFLWAKQTAGDVGKSITIGVDGSIYTIGDLGQNVYIQKFNTDGNLQWIRQINGNATNKGKGITTDTEGNIYTTGTFRGTADLDIGAGVQNVTSEGLNDIFIQKLDPNGNLLWVKHIGGFNNEEVLDITTDADGNVYTTGYFNGTTDFDPGPGVQSYTPTGYDIFIQKLDANGNFLWAKRMGGAEYEHGVSIVTDANMNVYTTGNFRGTVDFNPGSGIQQLTASGTKDVFIQKLDANGNFLWVKQMGGTGQDGGVAITADASGNTYTTGFFSGLADFDPGAGVQNLTSKGDSDIFIQKLDSEGNFLWAKQIGGSDGDGGMSITTNLNNNVYTVGYFSETADFNPGSNSMNLTSAGSKDIFIQKMNQCIPITGTDIQTACNSYTWIDGNTYTENDNTAIFNIIDGATNGCDSLVTLDLTINSVSDITMSVNGSTISANNSNATYQWIDCDNNTPISGATNQDLTPTINGNYAVEITENGCTEVSDCVQITTVGLVENHLEDEFTFFPNPTTGNFTIKFDNIQKNLTVRLFAVSGQLIEHNNFQNTHLVQLEINHPNGIYILEISDDDGNRAMLKLLKQ